MKKAIVFSLFFALFAVFPAIITFAQDVQEGNATWYEDDSLDLYASHARFPPGTMLQVTNLNNQREVYVTVMGRIQNSDNRILDISQAAAELLEMNRGYTPIRLVVIRGLVSEPTTASTNGSVREDVPEITAVSGFPYDDEYEDDYGGYDSSYGSYGYNSYSDETPSQTASTETPSSPPPPIRAYPQQTAPQSQQAQAAQPPSDQVLLRRIIVLINGKEQTIDVPDGVYIQNPYVQTPSTTVIPQYTPAPSRVYIQPTPPPAKPAPVQPVNPAIKIIPSLPDPYSGKVYRIQVGAFSQVPLAQACFERLRTAGLSPAYEINGSLYRVVLSGIKAADVFYTTQRLGAAGFTEAWVREESRY